MTEPNKEKTIADALEKERLDHLLDTLKKWDVALEKMYNTAPEKYKQPVDFDISPEDIGMEMEDDDIDIWKQVREQMKK